MTNIWGFLAPEFLPNSRRIRTLGLGATVRLFNELAVPGLGGVWYGKQLLLATLGVNVAEQARKNGAKVQNVEVANAIEALACWLAFKKNDWQSDARLRGKTKLQSKGDNFSFARVRQRNFYVSQPMRMATVQALPALGLVEAEGTRFNAFRCSDAGKEFIEQASKEYRPYKRSVVDHLLLWVRGEDIKTNTDALYKALSPLEPLSDDALLSLRKMLIHGGNENSENKKRRRNALTWVEVIRQKENQNKKTRAWSAKPQSIEDLHWRDLLAGAKFFSARNAAIAVLDAIEAHIGNKAQGQSHSLQADVPATLKYLLAELKTAAQAFLDTGHADKNATYFCRECVEDDSAALRSLVVRDGHVLRLVDDVIKPGPAFRGSAPTNSNANEDENGEYSPVASGIPLPEGISYRMRNLYLLNLDLHGELDEWLNSTSDGVQQ